MTLSQLANCLRNHAQQSDHRRLLVLSGERRWCRQQLLACGLPHGSVWLGEQPPLEIECLSSKQAQRLLGRSISQLVIDAFDGLNPNALGQASGALSGGGLLVLLCPPLADWPAYEDPEHRALAVSPYCSAQVGRRFVTRLIRLLRQDSATLIVEQHQPLPDWPTAPRAAARRHSDSEVPQPTLDQQRAVSAILNTARNRRQPLVITADRGRGKSAALGMAAARLMEQGQQVLLTAPNYQAVSEVFAFARRLLPQAEQGSGELRIEQGALRYLEPEQLLLQPSDGRVLLVDEAAAIPAPMLGRLLEQFNRIVFSSTVHGYEGTGRGFAVRFRARLDQRTPRWRGITLSQPVRWASGDPLEALIFDLLLMDAEAADDSAVAALFQGAAKPVLQLGELDRDQLLLDEERLRALFGLLVLAHYRTTPGDLRILLDSPNLRIWAAEADGQLLGCVLLADEGPLEPALAQAVWAGNRRPPGHLLPQTLIAQAGVLEAAPLRCARVMRIAVHPAAQRRGIGGRLLAAIAEQGHQNGLDYLGSSFAASADLLPFWQQAGFEPVRLGLSRDAVSGSYAVLVMQALSEPGRQLQRQLRQRYGEQLPELLYGLLADLERELIPQLLQGVVPAMPLNQQDRRDLEGFAHYNRTLDSSRFALRKLALQLLGERVALEDDRLQALLIEQLLPQGREGGEPKWRLQQLRELAAHCLALLDQA
ncbi:tRNA(Met) cytidine acetyltransferase TmcA [Marinobacterium arenosum]|uniref:tRNA(Met) cytidine acetyltransferase TmcA n=1 Tax=Marinobacterium arenosum TaxID=2862496 RepID=UPI001C98A3A6|nr:GNAT family N-acetyltransferase [Marinobacterium arenosum]MBY4677612.1 GNAT family N-acetyltransferase [Marinobacterium arenosum]